MSKRKPEPEIPQPDLEEDPIPYVRKTGNKKGVKYVAGHGKLNPEVMFLMPCLMEEDSVDERATSIGTTLKEEPMYAKSDYGVVLKDIADMAGIGSDHCWYSAVVKWLLPKKNRIKPPAKVTNWSTPALKEEIKRVKPKLVVCLGKQAFDALCPYTLKGDEIKLGLMYHEDLKVHYLLADPIHLLSRADFVEKLLVSLKEVKKILDNLDNGGVSSQIQEKLVINTAQELKDFVARMSKENRRLFAVDCEWAGDQFVDGKLRSWQAAWTKRRAAYVRFMDEKGNYTFDVSYEEAGKILSTHFDRKDVKYIGHHWSADSVWMRHWLKLETYQKCWMDTEFAQQTVNEHVDLGLDNLAIMYTGFGRYDMDLILWKKKHPLQPGDGYGKVPDSILIDYAIKDVLVTFESALKIFKSMQDQDLCDYYFNILNPFVTDVFTEFVYNGLPIDTDRLDELRDIYGYVLDKLETRFVKDVTKDSYQEFVNKLKLISEETEQPLDRKTVHLWLTSILAGKKDDILDDLKSFVGPSRWLKFMPIIPHLECVKEFNVRSPVHMPRWLFEVKGIEPVKSTNQREKGMPSMMWSKVKNLPPHIRKEYRPARDEQSLKIFAEDHPIIYQLLDLNSVASIRKSFLKPSELDENGKLVRENGLHYWVCSDGCIHPNYSLTETGRPRCWKPNALNWPKYMSKRLCSAIQNLFIEDEAQGILPEQFRRYTTDPVPSLRSIVKVPDGDVIVESDYATAEIRGLAYISGDQNLIRLVSEPDKSFGITKDGKEARLYYEEDSPISEENRKDEFLNAVWKDGKLVTKVSDEDWARDENGDIVHPDSYDLHWTLVEQMYETGREELNKDEHRDAQGKPGNFCIAEGQLVLTKHRGYVPIEEITTKDLLWDHISWVPHAGVLYKGEKLVLSYQGLTATEDHVVWSEEHGRVTLRDAIKQSLTLVVSDPRKAPIKDTSSIKIGLRKTYDILNAGPRNRFTCSGVLVSNSTSYGASTNSIERKIESDSGKKPPEGTGDKIMNALGTRQPVATAFLEDMQEKPKEVTEIRAASGRIRRFIGTNEKRFRNRDWESLMAAQGRECRNFPMQESVAATSAIACTKLLDEFRRKQMKARPMICLYDAVCSWCSLDEALEVEQLHEQKMYKENVWTYHGRELSYPIDTDYVIRWSTNPDSDDKAVLAKIGK